MIGGSSLPGVGRALPGFILAANYTELSRNAPIRRCERQQRDFLAALDDGQEISTSFDLNPSKKRHNFAIRRWTTFTTNDFTYHSPGHRRNSPECCRRRTGPRNGPIPRFPADVLHEATRCPAARRFTVIVPTCGAMGAVTNRPRDGHDRPRMRGSAGHARWGHLPGLGHATRLRRGGTLAHRSTRLHPPSHCQWPLHQRPLLHLRNRTTQRAGLWLHHDNQYRPNPSGQRRRTPLDAAPTGRVHSRDRS